MKFNGLPGDRHYGHRELPADQVRHRRPCTPIRYLHNFGGAREGFEQLAGQVVGRAHTRVSVRQLARIGFRVSDKLLEGLSRHRRIDGDAEKVGCHARNRVQVFDRIIERSALEQGLINVRQRAPKEDCIAVGAGTRDCGGTQRRAAAADVFNDHRAE
jgi:hypothetical protein